MEKKLNFLNSKNTKEKQNSFMRGEEEESIVNKNSIKKLNTLTQEKNSKNEKKVISQLPYLTIDCIFNKQNTWINLQRQEDPLKIMYDIWDENLWYPLNYISNNTEPDGRNKNEIEKKEKDNNKELINMDDIPAFFSFKDLIKPFTEEKLKTIQKNITEILKENIRALRKNDNKKTKFANVNFFSFFNFFKFSMKNMFIFSKCLWFCRK